MSTSHDSKSPFRASLRSAVPFMSAIMVGLVLGVGVLALCTPAAPRVARRSLGNFTLVEEGTKERLVFSTQYAPGGKVVGHAYINVRGGPGGKSPCLVVMIDDRAVHSGDDDAGDWLALIREHADRLRGSGDPVMTLKARDLEECTSLPLCSTDH